MRIGAIRRNAGTVHAKAALAGAGPAHARFAGEIAGKYGPIRPGVRSGQPLVFRVSSQEKGKSAGKGRERTPFRPPERSSVAGPVTPAKEKPEIRYRDIVRDRPDPAGKDRVIEREKVVERQKLVEREKVVEREKIVERSTVVVREAVRIVVEQRRIRETALSTDLNGRSDEAAKAVRESSASVRGANKNRKINKRMPENERTASVEEEARTRGTDVEDGDSFGNELSEAPRREASPAARTSLAETLAQRTSWPMSAKANAAFRRERDQASAAKIPLRAKASSASGKRKKAADLGKAKESSGSSQGKKPQAVYAQLLFLNPKLRVDGGKRSVDGGVNPSGAVVRANRVETPSPGEAEPQTERSSGSTAAHGNAESSSARQTEAQRENDRSGHSASSRRELLADVQSLTETRDAGGRLESGERVGEDAVDASRDAGNRRSDKAARRQARQEQTSHVDDTPSGLLIEGSSTSADGGIVSEEAQEHARSWSRHALRLSHALRPGTTRFEESSSSGVAKEEASSGGRTDGLQVELGERSAQPKAALGVRPWSLRRPGADSSLPLVYRSMTERERPIAAKRTIGLGMKTAATQAASAGSAASEPVRESRRLPQAETKLGLATGSLKLSHRLTRSSTGGGAAGRNALSASGETGQRGLARANGSGTTGESLGTDRGVQGLGRLTGEPGRDSAGSFQAPTIHANARVSGTADRADDRGQGAGDGARTPTIHAKARVSGASDRAGEGGRSSENGVRSNEGGQSSEDGVRSNEGGYQAGIRATPVHANIRGTRVSSRISDKAGLRNPGLVNAGLSGARGRIDQGKLVLLGQRNLLIPTDGPDRLAVHRQSGRPLSPAARTEFANPGLPAVRRGETGADVMRPVSDNILSRGANGEVSAGWQRDRSPLVQRGRRVPLSTVMSTGRMARATLPNAPSTHPIRQSLREPLLPIQQDSSAQLDRSDAPRLSLAHAALPRAGERRDAAVPGNAADPSVHTHEPDTPLEFRRNATVTAASNQARNAAPVPAAEISEEALQKAISALPQLHPDQLADQVYKSLMKRMKMEQRLHGF